MVVQRVHALDNYMYVTNQIRHIVVIGPQTCSTSFTASTLHSNQNLIKGELLSKTWLMLLQDVLR
jgi:hypothetical protein